MSTRTPKHSFVAARARRFVMAAVAVALALTTATASGAVRTHSSEVLPDGTPYVTLALESPWVPTSGSFAMNASVQIDKPTSYLEARLQILNPGGSLMFQKTEVRNDEPTGTVEFTFGRELSDLGLAPGAYPVELRVRSDSGTVREWIVRDTLILFDAGAEPVPLSLIVNVSSPTATDPSGRFVVDPATFDTARAEVEALCRLVLAQPALRIGLSIPPVLLEEWSRIASGYETSGPEGVKTVEPAEPTPVRYAATLELLDDALASNRIELLSTPYANPSISGLVQSNRVEDISDHLERGLSAVVASLESSPSPGVILDGGALPFSAIEPLLARGVDFAVVDASAVESGETTASSGVYTIGEGGDFRVLVTDAAVSAALLPADEMSVPRLLFERALSEEPTVPLVATAVIGPGRELDVATLADCLADLAEAPWLRLVTPTVAAASDPSGTASLGQTPTIDDGAPPGYWNEAAEARVYAEALIASAGSADPDALAASDASLIAQDSAWAGPDGSWSSADRGLGFSSAASRDAHLILDAVTISTQDMTLSSATGEVPLSITNGSGKTLTLRVVTKAFGVALTDEADVSVVVKPQDNFLTIPVDLRSSLSGRLDVQLWAGDLRLTNAEVAVRASYLDRLAVLGGASLILVGLLLFIRHRIRTAVTADTISSEIGGTHR